MISQAATEAVLRERLAEVGGRVLWCRTVASVAQDESGVTATLEGGTRVRGRYLVGADGMHSIVRETLGVGFPGMNTGIQDAVVLADALTRAVRGNDEHGLDEYVRDRKAVAGDVMRLADRLTRLATTSRGLRAVRNVALSTLSYLPGFRRRLAWQLSGLAHRPA